MLSTDLEVFLVDGNRKDREPHAKKTSPVMSPIAAEVSVLSALEVARRAAFTILPL